MKYVSVYACSRGPDYWPTPQVPRNQMCWNKNLFLPHLNSISRLFFFGSTEADPGFRAIPFYGHIVHFDQVTRRKDTMLMKNDRKTACTHSLGPVLLLLGIYTVCTNLSKISCS